MFLSQEVTLPLSFPLARARLLCLTSNGSLTMVSGEAFVAGRGDLLRVGPLGGVPGVSKLVRVQFAEPAPHDDRLVLPLRWEATGPAGRLFPVLDADIRLLPSGDTTLLVVAGSYRPPLDGFGAVVDTVLMHRVATATVCSLVHKIASGICTTAEAATAGPATAGPAAPPPRPAPELATSLRRGARLPLARRVRKRSA